MSAYIEKADIRLAGYSNGANVAVLADLRVLLAK